MALQTSGPISLLNVQNEFGGSNPIGMNEYYGAASGVPTSGAIGLNAFYGKSSVNYLPSVSRTLQNTVTGEGSKIVFYYVYWTGGASAVFSIPIRFGSTMGTITLQKVFTGVAGDSNTFPSESPITLAQFNAVPKTFIRTVEDANYRTDFYGVEPSDIGYSAVSFKGVTKPLRKATASSTPTTLPVATTGGVAVKRNYVKSNGTYFYYLNFLVDQLNYMNIADAPVSARTFTGDVRGGTLTFIGA